MKRERRYISKRRKDRIKIRDKYTCRYCNCKPDKIHIDHIKPLYQGGSDWSNNLVTSCVPCNSRKGGKRWYPNKIRRWRYIVSLYYIIKFKDYPKWVDFF